jgi:alpha-methylacyl-CoA racemase
MLQRATIEGFNMGARGPLSGVRVVEFAGIGPAPFCAMLLSDLGADVLRVDRPDGGPSPNDLTARGRASIALDLKIDEDRDLCLAILERADVLLEGFRPGVMERLGLGPEAAMAVNPRLIYGRMTGWGQTGPLAQAAGHDINYIALAGVLAGIGAAEGPPVPPLNLVGDFGGGALYLALGIAAALYEREQSGQGQVIDAAVVDGAASLMTIFGGLEKDGLTSLERGRNLLGGAAPQYRCYQCADGRWVSLAPLEPQFYALLLHKLGVSPQSAPQSHDPAHWPQGVDTLAEVFRTRPMEHWRVLLEGSDVCFAPVLAFGEAPLHPHNQARGTFVEAFGAVQPGPAPRFSRTPGEIQGPPVAAGEGGLDALRRWGVRLA